MPEWFYPPLFGICVYLMVYSTFRGLLGVVERDKLNISLHTVIVSINLVVVILSLHLGRV